MVQAETMACFVQNHCFSSKSQFRRMCLAAVDFLAKLHYVYFGDNFDEVNNATGGLPQGLSLSNYQIMAESRLTKNLSLASTTHRKMYRTP